MNTSRAFRVMNIFFIACAYQFHSYNAKAKDFRLSVVSVICFLAYIAWYTACVCKHFLDDVFTLHIFQGVAPFLFNCMHIHLLAGIKMTVLIVFECRTIAKASTHLCQVFGCSNQSRFTLSELVVYIILFSNLLLNIVLGIYDVAMIRPKQMNIERLMILSAVYTPHFSVACALKYLCIAIWLITQDLITSLVELQLILTRSNSKMMSSVITIEEPISVTSLEMVTRQQQYDPCPLDRSIDVQRILDRLKTIQLLSIEFNRAVQKQLNILVFISALVFVEASYAFMYFDLVWKEVLFDNYRNAFLATFACFYVFVLVDFVYLFLANHILSIKKEKFLIYVDDQLRDSEWSHEITRALLAIKDTLGKIGHFKILFVFDIGWKIFILGGGQIIMGVSIFILYQHINQRLFILSL